MQQTPKDVGPRRLSSPNLRTNSLNTRDAVKMHNNFSFGAKCLHACVFCRCLCLCLCVCNVMLRYVMTCYVVLCFSVYVVCCYAMLCCLILGYVVIILKCYDMLWNGVLWYSMVCYATL